MNGHMNALIFFNESETSFFWKKKERERERIHLYDHPKH